MRLKKLRLLSIIYFIFLIVNFIFEYYDISMPTHTFIILSIVLGFELIRSELLAIRRKIDPQLNDDVLEQERIEKEYQEQKLKKEITDS